MGQYHDLTFPNETSDYRAARDALLTAEIELRGQTNGPAIGYRLTVTTNRSEREGMTLSDVEENHVGLHCSTKCHRRCETPQRLAIKGSARRHESEAGSEARAALTQFWSPEIPSTWRTRTLRLHIRNR